MLFHSVLAIDAIDFSARAAPRSLPARFRQDVVNIASDASVNFDASRATALKCMS